MMSRLVRGRSHCRPVFFFFCFFTFFLEFLRFVFLSVREMGEGYGKGKQSEKERNTREYKRERERERKKRLKPLDWDAGTRGDGLGRAAVASAAAE